MNKAITSAVYSPLKARTAEQQKIAAARRAKKADRAHALCKKDQQMLVAGALAVAGSYTLKELMALRRR